MSINTIQAMDADSDTLRAKIFGEHYVAIRRTPLRTPWEQEVHAVNWFNTRSMFIYNFYNLIAGRSVTRVGGEPMFKGRLTKTLHGTEADSRGVVLVVKYPSAISFGSMLENLYFKAVSIFRTVAVSDFTFCLTQSSTKTTLANAKTDSHSYLVHHFRGNQQVLADAKKVADGSSVELIFSSLKSHDIVTVMAKQNEKPIPAVMDGFLLFRSNEVAALEDFAASNNYQGVIQATDTSFIGLLQRLM